MLEFLDHVETNDGDTPDELAVVVAHGRVAELTRELVVLHAWHPHPSCPHSETDDSKTRFLIARATVLRVTALSPARPGAARSDSGGSDGGR